MLVGVPKEIMQCEGRVALTPEGVGALKKANQKVLIQTQAGKESGFEDKDFLGARAEIKEQASDIYQADLVIKIKEPQEKEYELLKEGGILFAFLHLPANPRLIKILQDKKMTAIAYEGIQIESGKRPVLSAMSEIAGKIAIQVGAHYLRKENGGKGTLINQAKVIILGGGGTVGQAATKDALSLGAKVIAFDLPGKFPSINSASYQTEHSNPETIGKAIQEADLVVGAVAFPGQKAKKLVTRKMVASMEPGSVIVDVAIDEGGCIETSRPTTHQNPVFIEEGIIHYAVKNMPGAVPRSSTPALVKETLPYLLEISQKGLEKAIKENQGLAQGVYLYQGKITNQDIAQIAREKYYPLLTLLS